MSKRQDAWDERFGELLTRSYGQVDASGEFKERLLAELKELTANGRQRDGFGAEERDHHDEANWSRLLQRASAPCEPRPRFRSALLAGLKDRQAAIQAGAKGESGVRTVPAAHTPVHPRHEFKARLLDNLKERQRSATEMRRKSRNYAIRISALSSMAAAAMVVFVVWVQPFNPFAAQRSMADAGVASATHETAREPRVHAVPAAAESAAPIAPAAVQAVASTGGYRVSEVFGSTGLPATMRGIDMEMNDGGGWRPMDETLIAPVTRGVALRPRPDAATSGLGFGDGSTIHMLPDSIIEATGNGFAVRRGAMTVNVPGSSDSRFFLHFPERDVAIEPGTMLAVAVEPEERYAKGGAPAPVVKILDGGMAIARGKAGNGILLANQVYSLDGYVTPDLPGRPLYAAESAELERIMLAQSAPDAGHNPARMISDADAGAAYRASPNGYSKNGSRWIADGYDGKTPATRIQYLSDDYFGFANAHRELAGALALGSEVVIDGGDGVFYEIFK